jgi:SAM-dependent methyltransferase
MDLTTDQSNRIKEFIQKWVTEPRLELETTFGEGGVVDSTTFLHIAQRLRAKGFRPHAQEDRLNILTPNHIRFTLEGLGVLQAYCKDNSLDKKTFTAMIKDRAFQHDTLDVEDYAMRFKVRREEELSRNDPRIQAMVKQWDRQRKAFRLIRRWSFEGKGVRIDLSMVRQTVVLPEQGGFQWSKTFLEKSVLKELPRYEVEVELLHGEDTATPESALRALISGVGEVLRAIQKNSLLIRKSVANEVRAEYAELVGEMRFRGVGPVTMETKNMGREPLGETPNVRSGFNVTDKADGERAMGFVNRAGELYLVDKNLNIYRTGLANKECRSSLVDGEWVTLTKDKKPIHHYLLFDIYYKAEGEKVSALPFATFKEDVRDTEDESRYNVLKEWFSVWSKDVSVVAKGVTDANRLMIALKEFHFAPPGTTIFTSGCTSILDTPRIYHTDGLILTSNEAPLPDGLGVRFDHQFKWKPARENTVDFLVSFEKDTEYPTQDKIHTSVDQVTQLPIQYKTMRLYVGGKKSKEEANPRETILFQRLDEKEKGRERQKQYRPILFHPVEYPDPMANLCHSIIETDKETAEEYVMTEDSKEPIQHHSIVEMRYDPTREPGWRWIPSRIRHDKTERLQRAIAVATAQGKDIKYSGMMNDEGAANSVWNSIHDPVTESMIRSGNEQPTEAEWKAMLPSTEEKKDGEAGVDGTVKYYERKAPQESITLIRGLLDYHNKYIKNEILLKRALLGFGKSLLDLACGKGGDLYKWVTNHARHVVGIDLAADNISNPVDGAYRRYMDVIKEGYFRNPPKMAFVVGDSSKSIVDGEAAATPEDRDILRSIFGRAEPEGPLPPHIQKNFAGVLRGGADAAACMFALHYFFENKTALDGFLKNLDSTVKIGGLFVGCCFDGQKVFQLLQGLNKGQTRTGSENEVPIWSITKDYDADQLAESEESLGLGINVNFISIGMTHREYLVPFEFFMQRMRAIGFRLLNPEELAQFNLEYSTNTFDKSYRMAQESDTRGKGAKSGEEKYFMPEAVKEFSFLNRWFIFKRGGLSEAELEVPVAVSEAAVSEAVVSEAVVSEAAKSEAAKSEAAASEAINKRFGPDITRYNKTYALYSVVNSSVYSVLKPWEKRDVNGAFQKWFQPVDSVKRIVDATAHIGVDTINMSNVFPNAVIDAYEIVPETYQALVKNIVRFKKQQRIRPHNEDITSWEPSYTLDFLYVDPPWGGKNYAKEDSIDLYLQKEGNDHNESKNVNAMIDKWLASGKIRNIVMKAPKNFNKDYLLSKYQVDEVQVGNRQKGVAYTLLRIKAPTIVVDQAEPMEEVVSEADTEEKKEEDILAAFRIPQRVFRDKEIFLFGPSVAIRDSLKVKDRPAIKLTIKPDHAGRWLSFTAPFPMPDLDAKTEDGEPILYPTMEHYMAAMKYRHASNRPDLALSLFSRNGSIHQRFLKQRLEKKTMLGSGTPQDDKFLEDEAKEVRDKLTKAFTDKFRITFNEEKWNRPIRANDPLSMRDRILRDALGYRWKNDDNFRTILEELRVQKRYLLYTLGPDSDVSEWAGRLEVSGPEKGRIRGENRMGFFLMELAGYA